MEKKKATPERLVLQDLLPHIRTSSRWFSTGTACDLLCGQAGKARQRGYSSVTRLSEGCVGGGPLIDPSGPAYRASKVRR